MRSWLQKLLNLRPEEVLPASALFMLLFLVIGAYMTGQAIGDALFLGAFQKYYSHAIMSMGLVIGVLVAIYIRLSKRISLGRLQTGCLLLFALSFAVCWWLTGWNAGITRGSQGAVRLNGVVTLNTTSPHGLKPGDHVTVFGVPKRDFNGSFTIASTPADKQLTYEQPGPDAASGSGTVTFSMLFTGILYTAIFLLVYSAGALGPAMAWTLANFLLTTREARRVFGFVGAGGVLGGVVAGFVTSRVASRHPRPEFLLLLVGVAYCICAVLVQVVFARARGRLTETHCVQGAPRSFLDSARLLRDSRYLRLITALVFIGCVVTMIIGYQFKVIASQNFATKAELVRFFGIFYAWAGLASFALQLFLTGRLLRIFGIRVTLFILPAVFLLSTGYLLLFPTLLAAVFLKGSHHLLRYSLDKSSAEMLYLPVAPEVKSQVITFIDTFVWRVADGVAGVFLLVFSSKLLHFSPSQMGLLNFVFLGLWLAAAYGVRKEYLRVLRRAIETGTLDPERTSARTLDATTSELLLWQLQNADEKQIRYRLSLFKMGDRTPPREVLVPLLDHSSGAVRAYALRLLGEAGDTEIAEQAEKMLADPASEVRAEATHFLVVNTGRDPLNLLEAVGAVPAYCLQAAVITYLLSTDAERNGPGAVYILRGMLAEAGPDRARSRAEAARILAIAPPIPEVKPAVQELLYDPDPLVAEQALVTAGRIADLDFLPLIIARLSDPRLVAVARSALVQYGDRAVEPLCALLDDDAATLTVRKQVPPVLAAIATPAAGRALMTSVVQSDPGLRFVVLKALSRLHWQDKLDVDSTTCEEMILAEMMGLCRSMQIFEIFESDPTPAEQRPGAELLLTRALRERMEFELERIFRLLALIYPSHDMHNAHVGVRSSNRRLQANALEVLEQIVKADLFRPLSCLLDPDTGIREKVVFAERFCHIGVPTKAEALRILLHSEDKWLAACATYALGRLRLPPLIEEVRHLPPSDDRILNETRAWVASAGN